MTNGFPTGFDRVLLLLLCMAAAAPTRGAVALDSQQIQARLASLEKTGGDQEATSTATALRDLYQQVLEQLSKAEATVKQAAEYKLALTDAPKDTARLTRELQQFTKKFPPGGHAQFGKLAQPKLEATLARSKAEVQELSKDTQELQNSLSLLEGRPAANQKTLARIKSDLAKLEDELAAAGTPKSGDEIAETKSLLLQARRKALTAQISMLELERLSHDIRRERLKAELSLKEYRLARARERVEQIRNEMNRRGSVLAERVEALAAKAQAQVAGQNPLLQEAARGNTELGRQLAVVIEDTEATTRELSQIKRELARIDRNYERARRQLEIAVPDKTVAEFLLSQLTDLPDPDRYQRANRTLRKKISTVRLAQFRLQDQRDRLDDLERVVQALLDQAPAGTIVSATDRKRLHEHLYRQYSDRRALLDRMLQTYTHQLSQLEELSLDQEQLRAKIETFQDLLQQNLLWLANTTPVDSHWLASFRIPLARLGNPDRWRELAGHLAGGAARTPLTSTLVLLGFLVLIALRSRLRRLLDATSRWVGKVQHDRFTYTLEALLYTLLLSLPWPLLIHYLAWLLRAADQSRFDNAIGWGLWYAARILFVLGFLRNLYLKNGLAEGHFRWAAQSRKLLRGNLSWLLAPVVLLVALINTAEWMPDPLFRDTLGRMSFAILAALFGILAWRVLRPGSGLFGGVPARHLKGWRWRLRFLWLPLAIVVSLALIVLTIQGYYLAAQQLEQMLLRSVLVVALGFILYALATRGLLVAQRRLAYQRAVARRQAEIEARASREGADGGGDEMPDNAEMPEITLDAIKAQTRSLLRLSIALLTLSVLWTVWADLLPPLEKLTDTVLWQNLTTIEGKQILAPITVGDLLATLVALIVTFAAQRNLPGMLELTLLQPLNLEPGNRYAVANIVRYLILIAGLALAFGLLGIDWNDVQWLVAAMSVGLGFGLKEIFANFISGIIILFERPVRVGDAVTVGDVSGIVSRIRMRATTITDWDNKELVIPNQTLMVEPVINWTLSEEVTRITFPVGIAYGSDTDLAHRVIAGTVEENPLVLKEPAPSVLFTGFGDNSLDFQVRAFVRERRQRMALLHALHMALDKALRTHGIEIPFPQRDLHLRSVDPAVRWPGRQEGENEE